MRNNNLPIPIRDQNVREYMVKVGFIKQVKPVVDTIKTQAKPYINLAKKDYKRAKAYIKPKLDLAQTNVREYIKKTRPVVVKKVDDFLDKI